MTHDGAPAREHSLVKDESRTTSWDVARERLANPENPRTSWLATTRSDGRLHLMPVNAFWIDGAIDIVVEGRADPLMDEDAVRRVAEVLNAGDWPLEVKGDKVHGPNAPTAGPAPYTIYRIKPSRVFGLPGMYGMEQFEQEDLPKPTRWDFASD